MQREASSAVGASRVMWLSRRCQVEIRRFAHVAAEGNVVLSAGCDVQARPAGDGLGRPSARNDRRAEFMATETASSSPCAAEPVRLSAEDAAAVKVALVAEMCRRGQSAESIRALASDLIEALAAVDAATDPLPGAQAGGVVPALLREMLDEIRLVRQCLVDMDEGQAFTVVTA